MSKARLARLFALLISIAVLPQVAGCAQPKADDSLLEMDKIVAEKSSEISVFYPSADIIAEEKVVLDEKENLPLEAVRTLFAAKPNDPKLTVTLPRAKVNSVTIKDGLATVDFDSAVIVTGETAKTQQVALAAVIYTLQQFDGVEKVAFTVEGKSEGKIDGKDVAAFWGDVRIEDSPWDVTVEKTSEEGISSK